MDLTEVLVQLRKERDALDAVIVGMERLEHERKPGPDYPISLVPNRPNGGTNRVDGLPHHPGPDEEEPA